MAEDYAFVADLCKEIGDIPKHGILSRTIHNDNLFKAIIFGFDKDQELSEHTASMPAIINIVKGEARIKLGSEVFESKEGAWIRMRPGLTHSVYAKTQLIMLLIMLKPKEQ
jgi:quercetin dioxygenase-like cupin family protein